MDRWEWTRVGSAIAGSALAIYAIGWFTDLVYTVDHPARLAYQIPDYDAPAVDLAALQRDWPDGAGEPGRSEEHTSELQSLMRISYAVFCLKKQKNQRTSTN